MRKHFCKTTPTVRAQVAWEKDQTRVHKPFLKFVNIFWPDLHHLPILRKRFYHHVSNLENVKAGFIFSQINLWQRVVASNWAAGYLDIWSRKGRLLSMFPIDPLYHPIFFPSKKKLPKSVALIVLVVYFYQKGLINLIVQKKLIS